MDSRCEFQEKIKVNEQPRKITKRENVAQSGQVKRRKRSRYISGKRGAPVKEDSGRIKRILKMMKRAKSGGGQDNAATATTRTATPATRTATRRPRALVTTAYAWFPPFRLPLVS